MSDTNAEIIYSLEDVEKAIFEIEKIRDTHQATSKAFEYYNSIYFTLCSLEGILSDIKIYLRQTSIALMRLDILEKWMLCADKNQLITHEIIDEAKRLQIK